jgi:hypothetical protein
MKGIYANAARTRDAGMMHMMSRTIFFSFDADWIVEAR